MKPKRRSLKGKGAEIFLGSDAAGGEAGGMTAAPKQPQKEGMPESQNTIIPEYPNAASKEKATFYLPIEVLEDLEMLWREVRGLTRRKIKKSDIVRIALEDMSQGFKKWRAKEVESCRLVEQLSRR